MGSPFASQLPPKVLDVSGATVTIRKLSGLQFQEALRAGLSFRQSMLRSGIVSWTFDGVSLSPETIDDLDEESAELICREIVTLTKPSMLQAAEQGEAAQKNG